MKFVTIPVVLSAIMLTRAATAQPIDIRTEYDAWARQKRRFDIPSMVFAGGGFAAGFIKPKYTAGLFVNAAPLVTLIIYMAIDSNNFDDDAARAELGRPIDYLPLRLALTTKMRTYSIEASVYAACTLASGAFAYFGNEKDRRFWLFAGISLAVQIIRPTVLYFATNNLVKDIDAQLAYLKHPNPPSGEPMGFSLGPVMFSGTF